MRPKKPDSNNLLIFNVLFFLQKDSKKFFKHYKNKVLWIKPQNPA
ncbi:uncharacterized protein METZ01_LOCUS507965 [marine metagenome]|uniref:Uncharacterized protein n=1 Tax=marine metagenome TaxID=408172 RepID=A0A383EEF4_9ZZZZ